MLAAVNFDGGGEREAWSAETAEAPDPVSTACSSCAAGGGCRSHQGLSTGLPRPPAQSSFFNASTEAITTATRLVALEKSQRPRRPERKTVADRRAGMKSVAEPVNRSGSTGWGQDFTSGTAARVVRRNSSASPGDTERLRSAPPDFMGKAACHRPPSPASAASVCRSLQPSPRLAIQ